MESIKSDNSDLKELDLKILDLLLKDSRQSFREMAGKLGVSTTTVSSRVNKMIDDSVILGFTTVVDWEKIGFILPKRSMVL